MPVDNLMMLLRVAFALSLLRPFRHAIDTPPQLSDADIID
jgi:hypothetical protein